MVAFCAAAHLHQNQTCVLVYPGASFISAALYLTQRGLPHHNTGRVCASENTQIFLCDLQNRNVSGEKPALQQTFKNPDLPDEDRGKG